MRTANERGTRYRRLRMERLEPRLVLDASMLRITELMASNQDGLVDAEGDHSDWLELFNSGSDTVDLSGMYLTDNANNLTKWQIPAGVTMPGGGYRLVFASSKDGVLAGGELHTNFALSAGGEFLALVGVDGTTIIDQYAPEFPAQFEDISYGRTMQPSGASTTVLTTGAAAKAIVPSSGALGLSWTQVDFVDAAWPISGPTGLGYENSPGDAVNFTSQIQTPVPSGISTAYIRVAFNLPSLPKVGRLTLRMKYDDGFAAYINGVPVAEANVPETLQWDSATGADRTDAQALVFQDFDVSAVLPKLQVGVNVLAIHALNQPTGTDMLIVPELVAQPMSIATPEAFGYFATPTPGYGNGSSVAGFVEEPTFSVPHGFYSTAQSVAISTATPGAIVVYTTNGSTPTVNANLQVTNGTLYTSPITVSSTRVLRARAFRLNYEPSFVEASTYIFVNDVINQSLAGQVPAGWAANGVNGQTMDYGMDPDIINMYGAQAVRDSLLSLSTISITTDLANLFDPATGIYVNAMNRGRSWERPATVELINPDGSEGFEVNAGLRIRGGYSRNDFNPRHAFRFYFRGEYGETKLEFPLFGDEGEDEFDVLDLRTDQNYAWSTEGSTQHTMVREVFSRDTQADLGSQYTRSRYHHLYINGVYWGVFMTQERVEEGFAESYFGGDKEDYDIVKHGLADIGGTEISEGNDIAWRQLFNYGEALAASPVANANVYWTMQGLNPDGTRNESLPVLLDVDNLIDFMLTIFYTGGYDSGISRFLQDNRANNWFGVYDHEDQDEGFQFFIHDNEHSLGAENPTVHGSQNIDRTGPFNNGNQSNFAQFNPAYLHQDLLAHPEYKQRFIDHVQKHFFNGGALTVAANIARFQERVAQVESAVIAEAARWGDAKVATPRNKSTWQSEIDWIVGTYFPSRTNTVIGQLRNDGLYTPTTMTAPIFSQHGGMVANNYPLAITASAGTIYYTTDGVTDPRAIGGGVNPSAEVKNYTGPVAISGTTTVMARLRTAGGQWSGLVVATFETILAGDYDGNGTVEDNDYAVWRGSFGNNVQPGTGADGTGDGVINTADYVVWRDNLGATNLLVAGAGGETVEVALKTADDGGATATVVLESVSSPSTESVAESSSLDRSFSGMMAAIGSEFGQEFSKSGVSHRRLFSTADVDRMLTVDRNLVLISQHGSGPDGVQHASGAAVVDAALQDVGEDEWGFDVRTEFVEQVQVALGI